MRQSARRALAQSVNELADALNPEKDEEPEDAMESVLDRLALLLERDDLYAETVEHHSTGGRVRVKMTRGDSVRDQDEWVIEGEGESAGEAAAEFDELLEKYSGGWADEVRELDPWAEEAAP